MNKKNDVHPHNYYTTLFKTRNPHLQDFIEERGIFPKYRKGNMSYYPHTAALTSLLDLFEIQYYTIPNRFI